jgi:hypothetical protein
MHGSELTCEEQLWDLVLEQLDAQELQYAALQLSRAIPESRVSRSHFFRHVRICKEAQIRLLLYRLSERRHDDAAEVRQIAQSWTGETWRCVRVICLL